MVLYGIMARQQHDFIIWGIYFGLFIFIEQIIGKNENEKNSDSCKTYI